MREGPANKTVSRRVCAFLYLNERPVFQSLIQHPLSHRKEVTGLITNTHVAVIGSRPKHCKHCGHKQCKILHICGIHIRPFICLFQVESLNDHFASLFTAMCVGGLLIVSKQTKIRPSTVSYILYCSENLI